MTPHPTDRTADDRDAETRLRQGRVLIVGVGGLGTPAAWHLAHAGVGTLGLIDGDVVDPSNLHRQLLYRASDVGTSKVVVAARRLTAAFPRCTLTRFDERLTADNAMRIFSDFEFVIDGTDRIAAKYLVNDAAVLRGVPFSHAGVVGFQGQTFTVVPGQTACVRCLFPAPPPAGEVATCQEAGIIGSLAGSIGTLQAAEALKSILGTGRLLTDRLWTYDALRGRWRTVEIQRRRDCPLCGERPRIHRVEPVDAPASTCD